MRGLRAWLVTAGAVAALVLPAGASHADDAGALDFASLSPGSTRTGAVTVTNPSDGPVTVALAVLDLSDDDAGCVRPEVRAGDTTCGADGGELSQWLQVTVAHDGDVLWHGALTDLQEDRALPGVLRPGESRDLDITVDLPLASGNDTMTDRTGFDLRIRTLGETGDDVGDPEVLGAQASTGGSPGLHHSLVPTLIDAGLVGPATAAVGVVTDQLPEAVFVLLLAVTVAVTVRVARRQRDR